MRVYSARPRAVSFADELDEISKAGLRMFRHPGRESQASYSREHDAKSRRYRDFHLGGGGSQCNCVQVDRASQITDSGTWLQDETFTRGPIAGRENCCNVSRGIKRGFPKRSSFQRSPSGTERLAYPPSSGTLDVHLESPALAARTRWKRKTRRFEPNQIVFVRHTLTR